MQTEIIILRETFKESFKRDITTVVLAVGLIGMGLFLDSSAMQWFAFVMLVIWVLASAARILKDNRMSIAEARKRLDEIENE